jgi:hypothetical protein
MSLSEGGREEVWEKSYETLLNPPLRGEENVGNPS